MTKKPDRWERMLEKQVMQGESYDPFLHYKDVVKLLRTQHRWVERMIQNYETFCGQNANATFAQTEDMWKSRASQCRDILAKLKERAQ